MLNSSRSSLAPIGALLASFVSAAWAQPPSAPLPVKVKVVLTAPFCKTEFKKKVGLSSSVYKLGEAFCQGVESALGKSFESVTRIGAAPELPSNEPEVVLVPKFVDYGLTTGSLLGKGQEMLIVLEWTALGGNGKPIWLGTAKGTAQGNAGNTRWSASRNRKKIVSAAIDDLLANTVQAIAGSPELQRLGSTR